MKRCQWCEGDSLYIKYHDKECGVPLHSDRKLFEFIKSLPVKYFFNNGFSKNILRESCKEYVLDKVRLDRRKKGFNGSFSNIFDVKNKDFKNELFDKKSEIYEYFDFNIIKKMFEKDLTINHYSKFIFSFLNTKIFLEVKD